jgi:hypothetical protein
MDFLHARRRATEALKRLQERALGGPASRAGIFVLFAALFLGVLLLRPEIRRWLVTFWHLRVLPARVVTPHLATIHYNEMLRLLERRGIRKSPGQTPMEFASALPDGNLAAPVLELTSLYQAARFGGKPADPRLASSLLDRIHSFRRFR